MAHSTNDQKQPFLGHGFSIDDDDVEDVPAIHARARSSSFVLGHWSIMMHVGLFVVYSVAFFAAWQSMKCQSSTSFHDTSAFEYSMRRGFTHRDQTFHNLSQSTFFGDGEPNKIDEAWETLLQPMNMRFTGEEVHLADQETVQLPENGGFLGWFGVFHELHCLNIVRKAFRSIRTDNSMDAHAMAHVDHCIEFLRQTSMCKADTSLTSFVWHATTPKPMFNVSESTHHCVDWDVLLSETKDRFVTDDEMARLQNPLLSP